MEKNVDQLRLSIIVPVYNVENYLSRCVTSLLDQDINQYEIILIDDGSTDESGKLCDDLAKKYSHIHVAHISNSGVATARNIGIEMAKGEYIAYVDSDDYVRVNAFKQILSILDKTSADICYFGYSDIFPEKKEVQLTEVPQKLVYSGEEKYDFLKSIIGDRPEVSQYMFCGVSTWSGVVRKEILDKNHIRFLSNMKSLNEDMFYNLSICMNSQKIVIIPERLYYYCHNDNDSLTLSYREERFKTSKDTYSILCEQFANYILKDEDFCQRIERHFLNNITVCLKQECLYKKNTLNNVKSICNDSTVRSVIYKYPIKQCPFKQRMLFNAIKNKNYRFIIFLFWLLRMRINK